MNTLIVFSATWCGPCKRYKGAVHEIEALTDVRVLRIDIDQYPETTKSYAVKTVPTTVLEDEDGNEVDRLVGVKTADELYELIDQ